jgi:putative addiction module component (TIGR02574 family)
MTMAVSLWDLEQQARSLSADDRARLAEVLLESLQGSHLSDVEAAWNREIEERVAAYDRGELQSFPAEEVFAEAKRITR